MVIAADYQSEGPVTKPIDRPAFLRPRLSSEELRTIVVSLVMKLEIVEVKQLADYSFEVTMRNRYDKGITAVSASVGENSFYRSDHLFAELEPYQELSPGESDIYHYLCEPWKGEQVFIRTVVFSDLTSEGDHRDVEAILGKRLGMRIQINRIRPYLERLGKADPSLVRRELANLRRIAESLLLEKDDGSAMSSAVEHGLSHGRAFILKEISDMETELETDRIETFYQYGQRHDIRHSGYENFRNIFSRIKKHLDGLADRY
jgi:hypothetical protein